MNRRLGPVVALVAVGAGLIFLFRDRLAQLNQEELIRLSYLALLAILVGSGAFAFRERLSVQIRNALIWVLILCGIMAAYSFRDRFEALLNPSAPRAIGAAVELRRAEDGHFWANVMIDGVETRMMVDTGASVIALTPRDAQRIGLDPQSLRYVQPISTANGRTFAAPVVLDSVSVGALRVENVEANVMRENGDVSLLGMTFLALLLRP
jgi:aspartyl protease family protein